MSIRLCLGAGLLAFAANVFAGVVPKPIAPQLAIEVVQGQQEVAIDVPTTANAVGMQFGLIGALIGSAVQNSQAKGAEQRVVPIRDSLIGYDFNARLEQALRAKLASGDISPDPQFSFLTPAAIAERTAKRAEIPAQALVLVPRYSFDYDLRVLTVRIDATLENRERKRNGKYKVRPQFRHGYAFSFPIANEAKTAQPWVDLGRAGLAQVLDQGVAQVTDMVAYDFSDAGRLEWDRDNRKQFVRLKDRGYPGMGIRQEADFVWVRTGKFDNQVVQGWQPLDGPIAMAASAAASAPLAPAPATDAPATAEATAAVAPATEADAAAAPGAVVGEAAPVDAATSAAAPAAAAGATAAPAGITDTTDATAAPAIAPAAEPAVEGN